jgi:hypothetical protein
MIVDFQHHFTPRELLRDDPGDRLVLHGAFAPLRSRRTYPHDAAGIESAEMPKG